MRKVINAALRALLIIICLTCFETCVFAAVHNENTPYNWYCKHNRDGVQPVCDSGMKFIEKYGGYYIDKNNSDPEAAEKKIYLTFDAGYENGNIEKILDVLRDEKVPGAFFILENVVKTKPELVQRMLNEGHLVCNHTATHPDMTQFTSKEAFAAELSRMEDVFRSSTGSEISKYYRPPEGRFSEANLKFASELGYKTIFWSYGYVDWDNNNQMSSEAALEKVLSETHNGEVILLHPTSSTNAAIMKDLIDSWRKSGFSFGTLDELTSK